MCLRGLRGKNHCCNSRLRLHERHAGRLVVVGVDGRHHLAADRVEDGQRGERPGDLAVLRHAPQLFAGLLDGAVMDQLDAGRERSVHVNAQPQNETARQHTTQLDQPCWLHAQKNEEETA